ncbi:hypothetical protein IT403_01685 [Candidatus Nomurabacteria bacterium]|nr:hypothetical protein [Candidatus Nomurabacteria bacterium]
MHTKMVFKKIIATIMLGSVVFSLFGFSSQVYALPLPVIDTGANVAQGITAGSTTKEVIESVKDALIEAGKQILRSIAKRILARLTRDTINWINSGFDGKPLFLQDPQGFFVDLRNQEIKNLVNTIGYDPINYPFGRDIAIGLIQGTKNYFAQNAKYSLDQVIGGDQNRIEFQTNFSLGGWGAYTALAQPNNNRFGSQLMAKKINTKLTAGLNVGPGETIKTELNQAQGFLSQKKCENPMYDPDNTDPFIADDLNGDGSVDSQETEQQLALYNEVHVCERWETLTPGKVVSDQIGLALGSKYRQAELGQALGNSVSAIFDALLNKLVDDGLSALGDATGLTPQQDNFNYMGYTLGTGNSVSGSGSTWSSADIVIDLAEFRKEISNPTDPEELGGLERLDQVLIYQEQIIQEWRDIPAEIRALDMCIPGPDRFWQKRMDREFKREAKKLEKKAESKNPKKSQKAIRALRTLEYSIEEFKNYITNSMLLEIPGAPLYMDEITNFKDVSGEIERAVEQKLKYKTLRAKTLSMKNTINNPAFNPASLTTAQQGVIKNEYKRYLALRTSIPSEQEVDQKELELNKIQENRLRIQNLTSDCLDERTAKGWSSPDPKGNAVINGNQKENQLFCDWPMNDGYSYGDASEGDGSDDSSTTRPGATDDSTGPIITALNNILTVVADDADEGDEGDGSNGPVNAYNENDRFTYILVGTHLEGQPKPDGTAGYDIPIVNAIHVYKRFLTNVNIDISCDFVFPASILDYMNDGSGTY